MRSIVVVSPGFIMDVARTVFIAETEAWLRIPVCSFLSPVWSFWITTVSSSALGDGTSEVAGGMVG